MSDVQGACCVFFAVIQLTQLSCIFTLRHSFSCSLTNRYCFDTLCCYGPFLCSTHAAGLEHSICVPQMHMHFVSGIPTSLFCHMLHAHVLPSQDVGCLTFWLHIQDCQAQANMHKQHGTKGKIRQQTVLFQHMSSLCSIDHKLTGLLY